MILYKMKSKFFQYFFSTRLMIILMILFPFAMALGTFLESWYSTEAARIWIYNAWWFELLMAMLMILFFRQHSKI